MANDCSFDMKIIAKDESTLDRFERIMTYKDLKYYVYRVFEYQEYQREKIDNLWVSNACGTVAWSADQWINGGEDKNNRLDNGAYFTNLKQVCKDLDISIEIWTEEYGCCFQEHDIINRKGRALEYCESAYFWSDDEEHLDEDIKSMEDWCKENNVDPAEIHDGYIGGFPDYCLFKNAEELWEMEIA